MHGMCRQAFIGQNEKQKMKISQNLKRQEKNDFFFFK